MITEDYISLETARLLKDKGFRCDTNCYYNAQYDEIRTVSDTFMLDWNDVKYMKRLGMEGAVAIPTLQMVVKYLDTLGFYISVVPFDIMQKANDKIVRFVAKVYVKHPNHLDELTVDVFDSRQEATNAAILYVFNSIEFLNHYSSQTS